MPPTLLSAEDHSADDDPAAVARALLGTAAAGPVRVLGPLPGGRSNQAWLVAAGSERYALRLRGSGLLPDTLARMDDEATIWRAAHAAGLAPRLVAVDGARGALLSEYLEGTADAAGDLAGLCRALRKLHALECYPRALDYHAHFAFYCRAAGHATLPARVGALLDELGSVAAPGLCHHDPGPGNVIVGAAGPRLIDWEYAARGWPLMDWAAVVVDWQQTPGVVAAHADVRSEHLELACELYRQLCSWWTQAARRPATPDDGHDRGT